MCASRFLRTNNEFDRINCARFLTPYDYATKKSMDLTRLRSIPVRSLLGPNAIVIREFRQRWRRSDFEISPITQESSWTPVGKIPDFSSPFEEALFSALVSSLRQRGHRNSSNRQCQCYKEAALLRKDGRSMRIIRRGTIIKLATPTNLATMQAFRFIDTTQDSINSSTVTPQEIFSKVYLICTVPTSQNKVYICAVVRVLHATAAHQTLPGFTPPLFQESPAPHFLVTTNKSTKIHPSISLVDNTLFNFSRETAYPPRQQ